MANEITGALARLDTAIDVLEAARDCVTDVHAFTGDPAEAGSDGFFGPVLHAVKQLRGKVALNDSDVPVYTN